MKDPQKTVQSEQFARDGECAATDTGVTRRVLDSWHAKLFSCRTVVAIRRPTLFRLVLAASLSVSSAWAEECQSDADCGDPTMFCQHDDDAAPCAADGECPEPSPGTCTMDPLRCETDADCEAGATCEAVESSSSPCDPLPDASGCASDLGQSGLRECFVAPLTCQTDADCAVGLVCSQSAR